MKSLDPLIVVVLDHDHWRLAEHQVVPGTLVVFRSANALVDGIVSRGGYDVVLVTAPDDTGCRVAVHRDVTGRALMRAVSHARAQYGERIALRTTTVEAEADLELASIGERAGSLLAFAASRGPIDNDVDEDAETGDWFDDMLTWRGLV